MYQSKVFLKNDFFFHQKISNFMSSVPQKIGLLQSLEHEPVSKEHTQTTCADAVFVPHNVTFLGSHCELWSCWSPPHTNCNNLALPGAPYGKPTIR